MSLWYNPRLWLLVVGMAALAVNIEAWHLFLSGANGPLDAKSRPLFTDFISFWSAGQLGASAYKLEELFAHGQAALPGMTLQLPWHYPPPFLLVVWPFSLLPYLPAALLFQLLTIGALAALLWRPLGPLGLLFLLASPAILLNSLQGQNGALSASLLVVGVCLLGARPFLAGLVLAGLCYKPHFAILIGPLLLLTGQLRALSGMISGGLVLILLSLVFFGPEAWRAFFGNLEVARLLLETGAVKWHKMGSLFVGLRQLEVPVWAAWLGQGLLATTAFLLVLRVWLSETAFTPRLVTLTFAILLAAPFQFDYDQALLVPALLLWAASTRHKLDWAFIAALWLAPHEASWLPLLLFPALIRVARTRPA